MLIILKIHDCISNACQTNAECKIAINSYSEFYDMRPPSEKISVLQFVI